MRQVERAAYVALGVMGLMLGGCAGSPEAGRPRANRQPYLTNL